MGRAISDLQKVSGTIFAIDQTASHDGPGLRMTIYFKGCPLRCIWCHSPESIGPDPEVVWYETRCARCGRCVEVCPSGLRSLEKLQNSGAPVCQKCWKCIDACPNDALEVKGYSITAGELADQAERLIPFFKRTGGGLLLPAASRPCNPTLLTRWRSCAAVLGSR